MRASSAAAVAALLLASACSRGQTSGPQGFPPVAVKLTTVRASDVEDASEYVASLKSLHSTTIQPQIDGQITQIYVTSGDRVKEGSPILQIDPRRQQAAVSSQEAERAAREANVNFARQQRQRASELFTAGAISKQELEQAETGAGPERIEAVLRRQHAHHQNQPGDKQRRTSRHRDALPHFSRLFVDHRHTARE